MSKTQSERVIWKTFPAWSQFSWLYFFSCLTAFRGVLSFRFGLPGWQLWMVGALVLLLVVIMIRRWACYLVTPTSVMIKNGYTQHEIASMKLAMIKSIEVRQGPIARYWNIGSIAIRSSEQGEELWLRGVKDPDVVEAKIKALLPTEHVQEVM